MCGRGMFTRLCDSLNHVFNLYSPDYPLLRLLTAHRSHELSTKYTPRILWLWLGKSLFLVLSVSRSLEEDPTKNPLVKAVFCLNVFFAAFVFFGEGSFFWTVSSRHSVWPSQMSTQLCSCRGVIFINYRFVVTADNSVDTAIPLIHSHCLAPGFWKQNNVPRISVFFMKKWMIGTSPAESSVLKDGMFPACFPWLIFVSHFKWKQTFLSASAKERMTSRGWKWEGLHCGKWKDIWNGRLSGKTNTEFGTSNSGSWLQMSETEVGSFDIIDSASAPENQALFCLSQSTNLGFGNKYVRQSFQVTSFPELQLFWRLFDLTWMQPHDTHQAPLERLRTQAGRTGGTPVVPVELRSSTLSRPWPPGGDTVELASLW